ncbi:hypothetical protein HMPREF1863_00523 [Aedoeadaptatus coxii]|uniref:Uncharacterized protein n=1 Tax=Aedoeadaptatus coxii TaxID=755172 RepID=A0A134AI07_9FIRM|nr:hypothetical protein HMPREF1863_00523 [Peptoniphilus coxii]
MGGFDSHMFPPFIHKWSTGLCSEMGKCFYSIKEDHNEIF